MLAFNMNVTYQYLYRINKTTMHRAGIRYHEYDTNFIKVFRIYIYLYKQQKHLERCVKRVFHVGGYFYFLLYSI